MAITGRIIIFVVVTMVAAMVYLYLSQDKMVYPRREYRPDYQALVPATAVQLEYKISCGTQKGWYVPPKSATDPKALPERIWMLFGGNGSLALFWHDTIADTPDEDAGFILLDYPGYGFCEGEPSPASISESADAIVEHLAAHLGLDVGVLRKRPFRLMGHSLGSGVALDYATRHPVERIVLVAPFTSMRAMADMVVTPVFSWLLRHKVDNMESLEKITASGDVPEIIVIHGSADEIVPVEMGRQMEARFGDFIEYVEVDGANHTNILDGVEKYTAP